MSENLDPANHVKPYIHESLTSRALHFSICETQSRMSLKDPDALELEYTRTMMGFLLLHPDPRNIAMIGLGGGSVAKFCHRYLPASRIEVVEINPHVIALRGEFLVPLDGDRFRVTQGDGAQYVRYATTRPDVLLVDGFDSEGLPPCLCSQRFYDDCHDMLHSGGVLVVNLHYGHRDYDTHVDRIRRSFNGAALVVDDVESSNSIVFGCKGPALEKVARGVIRRPRALARAGADQLLGAFSLVSRALKDHRAA